MSDKSSKFNIRNVGGDVAGLAGGDISGVAGKNITGAVSGDMSGSQYNQSGNFGIGHMGGGQIQSGAKVAGVLNEAEQQNLADAAADIQKLLEQLEKSHPTSTTTGKMTIAAEAIATIDQDSKLSARILSALMAGGTSAIEQLLNHPAASFFVAALQDWQATKKKSD